jgi:hypothetical protein
LLTVPVGGGVVVGPGVGGGVVVGPGVGDGVAAGVGVGVGVGVGDGVAASNGEVRHAVVIVLPSRVTAPVLASARPWTTALVVIVMEA